MIFSNLQPAKAFFSICSTPSGILHTALPVRLNAIIILLPSVLIIRSPSSFKCLLFSSISTSSIFALMHRLPNFSTDLGNLIFLLWLLKNTYSPISLTESGISMFLIFSISPKALSPILSKPSGSFISSIYSLQTKKSSGMSFIPSAIIIFFALS